ncbi:MAG: tetratricopeptide repeat protein [Planctomycetota bacterium]|nr:tetratricopeptide repeat protein [Planctomycetota bacterium]
MNLPRTYRIAIKFGVAMLLAFVGTAYRERFWGENFTEAYQVPYWAGAILVMLVLAFGRSARATLSYFRFQSRIKPLLPGLGRERMVLFQAALAMHREQEERALEILGQLSGKPGGELARGERWLRALAGTQWLMRERRVLSNYREPYPQIHALFFSHGARRVPLRRQMLARELAEIQAAELDALARGYIELLDLLIPALDDPRHPFHSQAEDTLEFLTGRIYVLGARERFGAWWGRIKPVLMRGGGALLAGVRLTQRECYAESVGLLDRFRNEGVMSDEVETVRRAAAFFALLTRSQLRLGNDEIPRIFADLHYHGCVEMGLLRYPTAEQLPEVVECCKRGRDLRAAKEGFVDDAFRLWELFGDELAPHLAALIKRLSGHKGRKCPARIGYWREHWKQARGEFDRYEMLLMDGIAAASAGQLAAAAELFERAHELESEQSTPLVNLFYLKLLSGKEDEARRLAAEIVRRHPLDGGAFLALGRLFAAHLEDIEEAEYLFRRARDLDRHSLEPLILLGEVKLMEGRYAESQAYFDQAKQLDPSSLEAKLGLARTYMETKRWKLAIDNLLAVANDGAGEMQHLGHYHLYRTYREMSDNAKAIQYLDKVPPGFFKEPDDLDDIALHLESEQQYAKARVFSERAMLLRARGHGSNEGLEGAEI